MFSQESSHKSSLHLPLSSVDLTELQDFCSPQANRYELLKTSLKRRQLPSQTLHLNGARHLIVPLSPPSRKNKEFYRVTLVAHYDRVTGSPGANDNAAAVFQILAHLEEIQALRWQHCTQAVFTDKEEIPDRYSVATQGSWALAHQLKRLGSDKLLFLVLDMCGIGDIPLWKRNTHKIGLSSKKDKTAPVYTTMENFLTQFSQGEKYAINPFFSDDLGLLLGGYPALQLSLLPHREIKELIKNLVQVPKNHEVKIPPSWQTKHGPEDRPESLERRSFLLMARLLRALAQYRFPLV